MSYSQMGGIKLINTETSGYQHAPRSTRLANGNYVVTWIDSSGLNGDASGFGIVAQLFGSDGSKIGSEFLVNTQTQDYQLFPQAVALAGGGFVVTWTDFGIIAPDSTYVFGITTRAQIFGPDGIKVGGEFISGNANSSPQPNAMTGLADGGFVILTTNSSSGAFEINKYDATGALQSSGQPLVPPFGLYEQPSITALATGGYVVAWRMNSADPLGIYDVAAQVFDAAGGKAGAQFILSAQTNGLQSEPILTSLVNGSFVATWIDAEIGGFAGQVFSSSGIRIGSEFAVSLPANSDLTAIDVAALENGGFVVTSGQRTTESSSTITQDVHSISAQVYDANGVAQGLPYVVELESRHTLQGLTVTTPANGQFVISWGDYDGSQTDVRSVTFSPDPYERFITGGSGTDLLTGGALDDTLTGLAGNDSLLGGAGNDLLNGGLGNDILNGGTGIDTASYAIANSSVHVDLAIAGIQNTNGDGRDTLISIENLIGSAFSDFLAGNAGNNLLSGGAGNDTLNSKGGNDELIGGAGLDLLDGGGGNDILNGGAGADILTGGSGADTFVFDILTTSADKDKVTDFRHGVDHIALDRNVFSAFQFDLLGQIDPASFVIGSRALTADQHVIYDPRTGALYYDADGAEPGEAVQIATLDRNLTITSTDFLII